MTLRSRLNRQFQARHTPVHCAFLCRESSDSYSSAKPGSLLTLSDCQKIQGVSRGYDSGLSDPGAKT